MSANEGLSILEALENLNTLVDASSLDTIEVTERAKLIPHKEGSRGISWLKSTGDDKTEAAIKETFRVVYKYLQSFYEKLQQTEDKKRLVAGIGTIMVLVGEAAQKLDRFGVIFDEKVTDFKEYKALQSFYQDTIVKGFYKEFVGKKLPEKEESEKQWEEELEELLQGTEVEEVGGVHILNDIDVVKQDRLYELFYMKNEAGHAFFTSDLARKIKLACDFGQYAQGYFGNDPLLQITNWEDKSLHLLARKILSTSKVKIEKFYKEAMRYREMELVTALNNAVVGLMLAANSRNLIRSFSLKGCSRYFGDFQYFLRQVLHNRDWHKFLLYSPPTTTPFFQDLVSLVESLCFDLFSLGPDLAELHDAIENIIKSVEPRSGRSLSESIQFAQYALTETLKQHPSGPVFKAVDIIREETEGSRFDSWMQGNLPNPEGTLKWNNSEALLLRIPSPTIQEYVNEAFINEEFTTYLRALQQGKERHFHLFVNMQDRLSWKEHARSVVLEDLSKKAEYATVFSVVTLAKDSEFYHQTGHYHFLDDAEEFLQHWQEHLGEEASGYYFPQKLKNELFPTFVSELIAKIHEEFFDRKTTLVLRERLDFIELTNLFLILKLIEVLNPTRLSLVSKDSLDLEGTTTVGLIALLSAAHEKKLSAAEYKKIHTLLFGPTLMQRERVVHKDRIDRLLSVIELLEGKKNYLRAFADLYKKATLQMKWHD